MADIINSVKGGMFDSTSVVETPGGFPRGNKAVDSAFFAKMISSFYADGVLRDGGYAVTPGGGMSVSVSGGVAWIHGYMAWLEDSVTSTLEAGKSYAVLIRLNIPAGEFKLIITENTADLPTKGEAIIDLVIAEISTPSGTTAITAAMITDTRADKTKCGYVSNAVDGLGEALHTVNSDRLGNTPAAGYLMKSGGMMTGPLVASAENTGASVVRNISYGTQVPATLADGEIFIQIGE